MVDDQKPKLEVIEGGKLAAPTDAPISDEAWTSLGLVYREDLLCRLRRDLEEAQRQVEAKRKARKYLSLDMIRDDPE